MYLSFDDKLYVEYVDIEHSSYSLFRYSNISISIYLSIADTDADHELKFGVLDDVFTLVDFDHKLKGNEEHVEGFDLVYDQATNFKPP